MNLFDRYFLVLAGRMRGDECGGIATVSDSGDLAIRLGWPLDLPDDSGPQLFETGTSNLTK